MIQETHKREPQKRPTKETHKRNPQKLYLPTYVHMYSNICDCHNITISRLHKNFCTQKTYMSLCISNILRTGFYYFTNRTNAVTDHLAVCCSVLQRVAMYCNVLCCNIFANLKALRTPRIKHVGGSATKKNQNASSISNLYRKSMSSILNLWIQYANSIFN